MQALPRDRAPPPGAGLSVLVVEDEASALEFLIYFLEQDGFEVTGVGDLASARECAAGQRFDLVLVDKNLPDGSGLGFAREMMQECRGCEIVMMSAFANIDSTVEAIQLGVADFLVKPFDDLETLRSRLQRVLDMQRLKRANEKLVQDLQEKNALLESLVIRDPLTTLYNHAYFHESVVREVNRSARHLLDFAVLFVDVDGFKDVNDSEGHLFGDEVLKLLSGVLRGTGANGSGHFRLRKEDIAARYGGDEFALILPSTAKAGACTKAEQLRKAVEETDFGLGAGKMTVSIGVASYPLDATAHRDLVSAADSSLYVAKRTGRNRVVAFSETVAAAEEATGHRQKAIARNAVALTETIAGAQLDFLYQPIVDLETRSVFAYEALCRPSHPVFPSPVQLLHTAELSGRIVELGRIMRGRAAAHLRDLPDDTLLFINLHPMEVSDEMLHEVDPLVRPNAHRVVYEITETAALTDHQRTREILQRLREAGFRIALDDLGAGYAGLHSLTLLAPDFVKIDMSLIRGIHEDSRTARLIQHILDYAHGEGMKVIAEGVETLEERDVVVGLGCRLLQGYFFGRPSPPFASPDFEPEDP